MHTDMRKKRKWIRPFAEAVNDLVRKYEALPRFREMIEQWTARQGNRVEARREWDAKRRKHFEKLEEQRKQKLAKKPEDKPLRVNAGKPPKRGWKYEPERVAGKRIYGWVPPELSWEARPNADCFVQMKKPLELDEQYTLLAAVHDAVLAGVAKIDPWESQADNSPSSVKKRMPYLIRCQPNILLPDIEEHELELRIFLADVEADLKPGGGKRGHSGKRRPGRPPKSGDTDPKLDAAIYREWKRAYQKGKYETKAQLSQNLPASITRRIPSEIARDLKRLTDYVKAAIDRARKR